MNRKSILIATLLFAATLITYAADIGIKWAANPAADNVTKYNVYMAVGPSTTYTLVGSTTNTFFTNTNLTIGVYRWKVAAVNEWGEGPASVPLASAASLPTSVINLTF